MDLKLKKFCITLCGVSVFNGAYAANSGDANLAPPKKPAITKSVASEVAQEDATPNSAEDKIVLNFENADIQSVIKAISKLSGKNFVIDPRVKGTVNIVSEKPVSKAESYKVLESALRMQGFATVEADGVIKVLPETDARTYGMRISSNGPNKNNHGDQLITKIYTIDNGSATQLANALRPMISPNNSIAVYQNSNSLIVTDYASNMNRISKIINELRITNVNRVAPSTIHLKYATAADVAQTLQASIGNGGSGMSGSGGGGGGMGDNGPAVNITVDSSTNSIILSSNVASKIQDLRNLALQLDKNASTSNNNMHVVYLKNADAAHVAEVLKVIASGQDNPDMTASPPSRALSDTSSVFQNGSGGGSGSNASFGGGGNRSMQMSGMGNRSNSSSGFPGGGSNDKNTPKVLIQAEATTNALIIQAPEQIYRNLRMVVSLLDVRRVQVMIEALIADVSTSEQGTFGIQWIGGAGNNNVGVGVISNYAGGGSNVSSLAAAAMALKGGTNTNGGAGIGQVPSIPGEVYVGLVTGTTTIGGMQVPSISTLADMLAANSASNILGRPTLLTMDNEEAQIFVGQNVGVPTGSFQNSAASPGSISSTVNRQDVGTILRIKPLVTQNGSLQLSVYEEDSVTDNSGLTAQLLQTNGPNFKKRNVKTQIVVDDGQIIALGGMTSDSIQMINNGIPLLSAIPYLGWLFSWQKREHVKSNLVIFLRPVIIRNEEGYRALTNQRYRYIMDQQNSIQAKGNILMPRIDAVNLENQVPYDDKIPAQKAKTSEVPLVDLRTTAIQSGTTKLTAPQPLNQVLNQDSKSEEEQTNASPAINAPKVIQNAPNSISITNN
jgi:general secretion pathway protein D